ncbi:hypothetical protein [Streptomyces sp. NBC_01235]|uniref:hypothetical protein n=1 Tax=Streptomyces sp. NBC_01235 TaxID=2903788 RepID=UPI003FA34E26
MNRVIKFVGRSAYGFRNPANQRLRARCVTTRRARGHLRTAQLRRPALQRHEGTTLRGPTVRLPHTYEPMHHPG